MDRIDKKLLPSVCGWKKKMLRVTFKILVGVEKALSIGEHRGEGGLVWGEIVFDLEYVMITGIEKFEWRGRLIWGRGTWGKGQHGRIVGKTPACGAGMSGGHRFKSWLLHLRSRSLLMFLGMQWKMGQVPGYLHPDEKSRRSCSGRPLFCLFLSPSITLPFK